MIVKFCSEDIIRIFNTLFSQSENTQLVGEGEEPVYLPASSETHFNQIIFTQDYFASALHEISHWCIAGSERRKHIDYSYWYEPDGRSEDQQKEFEKVEVKPQALEWVFHKSCGHKFVISVDNLKGDSIETKSFEEAVVRQVELFLRDGLPGNADAFVKALQDFYGQEIDCNALSTT